jgi:metalloendopeptidase OMA1, mitochondrial
MNCLRKSRAVLPRKPTVISAPRPLPAAQARFYSASRVPRGYATPRQTPSHRHSLTASPPSKWFPLWQKLEPVLIVGGGALAVYLSIVETVPFTNRRRFMVMSRKFERELGEDMFAREKRLVWPNILPPDHPDSVRVRRIASEIVRAVDRGLDDHRRRETGARAIMFRMERLLRQPQTSSLLDGWEVIVVKDDKIVNAECVPGGKIIVYTGILENFKEDAEIATVVGHEVGILDCRLVFRGCGST